MVCVAWASGAAATWAGVCPGNHESAGKRLSGRTRKGSPWLRQALVEAAHGAARSKRTYVGAQYRRIAARRGKKRAAVAVGHTILVMAYQVLTRREGYRELGANYFDEHNQRRVERRLVARLKQLGYSVDLKREAGQPHPESHALVSQSVDHVSDQPVLSVP